MALSASLDAAVRTYCHGGDEKVEGPGGRGWTSVCQPAVRG
jgi:hypothetical protein